MSAGVDRSLYDQAGHGRQLIAVRVRWKSPWAPMVDSAAGGQKRYRTLTPASGSSSPLHLNIPELPLRVRKAAEAVRV